MTNIINVETKEALDVLLASSEGKVVLVDFWASWCGPCKMLIPVLENLAGEYTDQVVLAKLCVETPEIQAVAQDHGVSSIPHVFMYKDGEQVDQFIGAMPIDKIKELVEKHI